MFAVVLSSLWTDCQGYVLVFNLSDYGLVAFNSTVVVKLSVVQSLYCQAYGIVHKFRSWFVLLVPAQSIFFYCPDSSRIRQKMTSLCHVSSKLCHVSSNLCLFGSILYHVSSNLHHVSSNLHHVSSNCCFHCNFSSRTRNEVI